MKKTVKNKAVVKEKFVKLFPTKPKEIEAMKESLAANLIELMRRNQELKASRVILKAESSKVLDQAVVGEKEARKMTTLARKA